MNTLLFLLQLVLSGAGTPSFSGASNVPTSNADLPLTLTGDIIAYSTITIPDDPPGYKHVPEGQICPAGYADFLGTPPGFNYPILIALRWCVATPFERVRVFVDEKSCIEGLAHQKPHSRAAPPECDTRFVWIPCSTVDLPGSTDAPRFHDCGTLPSVGIDPIYFKRRFEPRRAR